jgi:BirA family biotin operon repressor/biotin-[acetyl-CoA-carboxylase] ligase
VPNPHGDSEAARLADILAASGGLAGRLVRDVAWVPSTDSTNRVLADGLRAGEPVGRVLVADHQTGGRGRMGRAWEAPPRTGLLMSWTVAAPAPASFGLVPLAVGLAAVEAIAGMVGAVPGGSPGVDLKWPNDLMVGSRKLAGILCEAVTVPGSAGPGSQGQGSHGQGSQGPGGLRVAGIVCGMGTNRVRPALVEGVLAERGVWLDDLGVGIGPFELAAAILGGAFNALDLVGRDPAAFVDAYSRRCSTLGGRVRVELADGVLEGLAESIRADGALVVRGPEGPVAVTAGDVVLMRPAGSV